MSGAREPFAEWLRENPPPDLQVLAETYAGLSNVPDHAWREHQRALDEWRLKLRHRHQE